MSVFNALQCTCHVGILHPLHVMLGRVAAHEQLQHHSSRLLR